MLMFYAKTGTGSAAKPGFNNKAFISGGSANVRSEKVLLLPNWYFHLSIDVKTYIFDMKLQCLNQYILNSKQLGLSVEIFQKKTADLETVTSKTF